MYVTSYVLDITKQQFKSKVTKTKVSVTSNMNAVNKAILEKMLFKKKKKPLI